MAKPWRTPLDPSCMDLAHEIIDDVLRDYLAGQPEQDVYIRIAQIIQHKGKIK